MTDFLIWLLFWVLGVFSGWGACEYYRVSRVETQKDIYRMLFQTKHRDVIKSWLVLNTKKEISDALDA